MFKKQKKTDWGEIANKLAELEPKRMKRLVQIATKIRSNKNELDVFINGRPDEVDRITKEIKEDAKLV